MRATRQLEVIRDRHSSLQNSVSSLLHVTAGDEAKALIEQIDGGFSELATAKEEVLHPVLTRRGHGAVCARAEAMASVVEHLLSRLRRHSHGPRFIATAQVLSESLQLLFDFEEKQLLPKAVSEMSAEDLRAAAERFTPPKPPAPQIAPRTRSASASRRTSQVSVPR